MSQRQHADEVEMRCCGGSGIADHGTVPCTAGGCDAASRWFTAAHPPAVPDSSALAAHDDMVGYGSTPVFDVIAEQLGGDPRGARVLTWKEISYAGGRRRVNDGEGGGAGGFTAPGRG